MSEKEPKAKGVSLDEKVKAEELLYASLFHQGDHEFHPAGAPTARIRFAMDGARAVSFEIKNPERILTARRS